MVDWIESRLLAEGMVSPEDVALMRLTDDPDEAVATIVECCGRRGQAPSEAAKADGQ